MATGLTRQYYTRGGQGTFVYSPDIAVFISTQQNGIIDLSQHIVDFDLSRVVNSVSTFTCTFDNKFAIYDRRIRRMDRIVVFLKRTSWMQVFSGYIVEAPWQTVVPGNATLRAECTLKRLKHSYFDPTSLETQEAFPFFNQNTDWTTTDGGAAATLVRLLQEVAMWNIGQIQIQKIPEKWIRRAAKLIKKLVKSTSDEELSQEYQTIVQAMSNLIDAMGWQGYINGSKDWIENTNKPVPKEASAGVGLYSDEQWQKLVGKQSVGIFPINSGIVDSSGGHIHLDYPQFLFNLLVMGTNVTQSYKATKATELGNQLLLRLDAADALAKLLKEFQAKAGTIRRIWDIEYGYLSFDDAKDIWQKRAGNPPADNANEEKWLQYYQKGNATGMLAPINNSEFLWGTAIKIRSGGNLAQWFAQSENNHVQFGWYKMPGAKDCYVFRGSPVYWDATGRPAEQAELDLIQTGASINLSGTGGPTNTFSDASVFSFMFYYPGWDWQSDSLTGSRAWINDVPLLEYIQKVCGASQRNFMSAPNGDFIAFFPDRLGHYTNFPSLRVRDIEVVDFKAIVSDDSLITHYISYGDFIVPTAPGNHNHVMDTLFTGGSISVQQPDVLKFLLGIDDSEAADLGSQLVQMFGIRPKVEQSYYIRNRAYNFAIALHSFQELWANQWRFLAEFTFLPEIYPGMRIELVDREPNPMGVYVESVTHSGNRTSGFRTSVVVSTPTVFQNGRWVMLKPEIAPDSPLLPQTEAAMDSLQVAFDAAAQKADMFAGGINNLDGSSGPGGGGLGGRPAI